jgi:uncharacterized protein
MAKSKKKTGKSRRGFAALSARERSKIASMGGKAAHRKGTAHEFTKAEAKKAARTRWK